jgi:excinuclease ABC subunit A
VGTVTEIYDYLRLLYARIGIPHCPRCGREITRQSSQQIVDSIQSLPEGTRILVMAPLIKDRKGHHQAIFAEVRKAGFVRVRVDGVVREVDEQIELDRYKMHTIEAVVDRLMVRPDEAGDRARLADSVETALRLGDGVVVVQNVSTDPPQDILFSEHLACVYCGLSFAELEPRSFSFNSPHGACPTCQGLGTQMEIDPDLVIPNKDLSLNQGAIRPWNLTANGDSYYTQLLKAAATRFHIPMDVPVRELSDEQMHIMLYGSKEERVHIRYRNRQGYWREYQTTFEGVVPNLQRRYHETSSDYMRGRIEDYMAYRPCPACSGKRLKLESLAVTVADTSIADLTAMPVSQTLAWVGHLPDLLTKRQQAIAQRILKEIRDRLTFMADVGLDYLTLNRRAGTLAGGEAQRIRLATQIGSQLMGVLYILDEPSIGLHQRDNARLIRTLQGMRDLGNTLVVVEHDDATIHAADWIIDLGPGAGEHGGEIVFTGPVSKLLRHSTSITGQYLSGRKRIAVPETRRAGNGQEIVINGAAEHNLKGIDVRVPLGKFVCITGVSGSGKSTLLIEVLYKRLAQMLHGAREKPGRHEAILGAEAIDKAINIDQSPIGRTPRSNPATYTNLFTPIRELFASLPESKIRGYKPGRFSFNVKGGRCEACEGQGTLRIEMQFLPDIYIPCDVCHGRRYNRETLQVYYKGLNIAQVLDLTVDEAAEFFAAIPKIVRKLKTLQNVGLGYVRLGQPAPTLSGGEAQRIKLSRELSKLATGRTLYILDEPSVGLHAADVHKLVNVLNRLVDGGNTVAIIEHHPDIIKVADWVIDLGPEGGDDGGYVVAEGTPEQVACVESSYTGQFLARVLSPPCG